MTGFALGVSATAGLWSALVIAGTALLLLGVVMAVSATLPSYSEKEKADRTEWGLIVSVIGAAMVLIGTVEELRRHVGWIYLACDGAVLVFVIWQVSSILCRMVRFRSVTRNVKVGGKESPKETSKHPQSHHCFGQDHVVAHDADGDGRSEVPKKAVTGQARVPPRELPEP
jgi:hypothetical protein